MNSDVRGFLDRVTVLNIGGRNFGSLTRQALQSKFGGGGDALLSGMSDETLGNPNMFAGEMFDIFGKGAVQFFSMIIKFYESGRYQPPQGPTVAEQLLLELGHPGERSAGPHMVPLHDFRIKDEEGNYADEGD